MGFNTGKPPPGSRNQLFNCELLHGCMLVAGCRLLVTKLHAGYRVTARWLPGYWPPVYGSTVGCLLRWAEKVLYGPLGSRDGVIWTPGRPRRCYMGPWAAEMVLYEALGGGQGVIWTPGLPKRCYMGPWAAEMVLYEARGGG